MSPELPLEEMDFDSGFELIQARLQERDREIVHGVHAEVVAACSGEKEFA